MKASNLLFILLTLTLPMVIFACSESNSPTSPSNPAQILSSRNGLFDSTGLLGAYELTVDSISKTADLIPKRGISLGESYLVEGIGFFMFSPCSDCFKMTGIGLHGNEIKLIFSVKHPFEPGDPGLPPTAVNRLDLDVFDLAVVVDPADSTPTHFELFDQDIYDKCIMEPDGYTTELSELLQDSTALPFVLVVDDTESQDASTFNKFAMGAEANVDLTFPLTTGTTLNFDLYLTMGYGASAKKPDRLNPKYYNPEFNKKPAWKVEVLPSGPWLDISPLPVPITVKVWDWQTDATVYATPDDFLNAPPDNVWAASEVESVSVEIPGMTASPIESTTPINGNGTPSDPLIYEISVPNVNMVPPGWYTGCVKVLDERTPLAPVNSRDFLIHKPLSNADLENYSIPEYATYQTFRAQVAHAGVSFSQLNCVIGPSPDDPMPIDDSSYGNVDVGFIGKADPQFFNLSVNGVWLIQNVPLISLYGEGLPCCITLSFDLMVPHGVDVTEVLAGWSLDTEPAVVMPPPSGYFAVGERESVMFPSAPGFTGLILPVDPFIIFPPWPFLAIAVRGGPIYNQECKEDECVATAVSNSLKYLHDKSGSPPDGKATDPATMKDAVGQKKSYPPENWAATKNNYMNANGYNVDTSSIPPTGNSYSHDATSADCDAALAAVNQGKDVEMNGRFHCAQVVAMSKLADGSYMITLAHDIDQEHDDSGVTVEAVRYDPNAYQPHIDGSNMYLNGHAMNGFTVEGASS